MIDDQTSNSLKTSGKNISYWIDSTEPILYEKLNQNITADVAVIGGGISGITIAYLLSRENIKVVVIEDGLIGSGETGRTTAHLVNALDDRYYELENIFGEEKTFLAAESHTAAINYIESIVKQENINCNFERVDGYLFLHSSDKNENLDKELKAASKAGLNISSVSEIPGLKLIDGPALKFANQAQFHPLKYLNGLCNKIILNGGKIFTQTHAEEILNKMIKTSDGHSVNAENIVVATNTPISNRFVIHTKQFPYRTYVLAFKIPRSALPKALWWDTGDQNSVWHTHPYHYVRVSDYDDNFDLLISGGEDHKTGQADEENIPEEERYNKLYDWTKKHFPIAGDVLYNWSGQVMEPMDSLAYIGKNPGDDNTYIATGDSGNGMTHGTLAGMIISDLILSRINKYSELYDPSRKTIKTLNIFLEEQLNVAKQYLNLFIPGDVQNLDELLAGEGAIIKDSLKKFAVFRDENGKYHLFSAVCPHLKCIVEWNKDEKTFDCPCHGSRFNCYGTVINGPANKDLEMLEREKVKIG
jgi:glycine/D-amino acid oxidase-like deaminating enzyme/nitrite reductase/ring-hydroxylating ferredoxin subunit